MGQVFFSYLFKERIKEGTMGDVENRKGFFYRLFSGLIIGIGTIIPGVSGGVLAIILGLYQPLIETAAHPLTNWRKNLGVILPVGIGVGCSVLVLSNLLDYLFIHYPIPLLYLFVGLVLGSVPSVIRIANQHGFRLSYAVPLTAGFFLMYWIGHLPQMEGLVLTESWLSSLWYGILVAVGTVVPGLSSSFLLMAFGVYHELLAAVARLDFITLLPVLLSFVPGVWLCSKGISWLFKHVYGWTYYGIIGILLASLLVVFPGLPRTVGEGFISLLLLVGGVWGSISLSRYLAS